MEIWFLNLLTKGFKVENIHSEDALHEFLMNNHMFWSSLIWVSITLIKFVALRMTWVSKLKGFMLSIAKSIRELFFRETFFF